MEYHIRLQYVVGEIGHKSIQSLCREVAQGMGHSDLRTLLNDPRVMSQIHHLRGIKDVCDVDNEKMMNVLTERQWYSLYVKTDKQTGCCRVIAKEDVYNRLDIHLVYKLMKYIFNACIQEDIIMALGVLYELKENISRDIYTEEKDFEEIFREIRGSLLTIASYAGTQIARDLDKAKHTEIQVLVNTDYLNFLKLQMLLMDPAERIMRSTMNVAMCRAGFKDREEMFENPFFQSELSRKAAIWSNRRGCQKGQRSFVEQIFDFKAHMRSVKQTVKQCLCSFDFDFLYKMMRDISVLSLELTPYTKDGIFSFIKTLREIYGLVMRGCPDNKIRRSEFLKYWKSCEETLKVLLRFTGYPYEEEISSTWQGMLNNIFSQKSHARYSGKPVVFRVRLEFPPDGLTKYEYSRTRMIEALRKHDKDTGDRSHHYLPFFDDENHDLIYVHYHKGKATENCEEFFNSEAVLTEIDTHKSKDDKRNPVVCLIDPTVHQNSGRQKYIGIALESTLQEITEMDFTNITYTYMLDSNYCSDVEKQQLFKTIDRVLTAKITAVQETIRSYDTSKHLVETLEQYRRNEGGEQKKTFKMSDDFKSWLYRNTPARIQCFSISHRVKICTKEDEQEHLRTEILDGGFATENDLEFIVMNKSLKFIPLFRPGCHVYQDQRGDTYGSIGLYGELQPKEKGACKMRKKLVAISHGHVVQNDKTAFVNFHGDTNAREVLGKCIFPPYVEGETYPDKLSIIEVTNDTVKTHLEDRQQNYKRVKIHKEDAVKLSKRRVVKYGASTQRTVGFVVEPSFHANVFDKVCEGIVIEEHSGGKFAEPGDSGALTYIPRHNEITGVSLVYSSFELPDVRHPILTTKFDDCKKEFETSTDKELLIVSDHGLSLMGNIQGQ